MSKRSVRRSYKRSARRVARTARRSARTERRAARRSARRVARKERRAVKRVERKAVKPEPAEILKSSYGVAGLAEMLKEDEKGYKAQKVHKKKPSSFGIGKMLKEDEKGYKAQKVHKKEERDPIDSFLEGIGSEESEQPVVKEAPKKKSPKKSEWIQFVTEFHKNEKKKNPDYKYKEALKDAAKVYKK